MRDPYLYPDTEILKNLLGIMDSRRLQEAESDYVTLRLSEIAEDGRVAGVFDFSALCRHFIPYQVVYLFSSSSKNLSQFRPFPTEMSW
jgi:cell filamentation protein